MSEHPDQSPAHDPETSRVRTLLGLWLIGGAVISFIVGYIAYGLSGFCICDAPIRPKPEVGLLVGEIAFGVWSVLCGIGYVLRRTVIAIWIPIVPGVLVIGFVIFLIIALS